MAQTDYVRNDAITATLTSATGRYLFDFPISAVTVDGGNTVHYSCTFTYYDGLGWAPGQQSGLTLGQMTTKEQFTDCGTAAGNFGPSGLMRTTYTYDAWGNQLTTTDPDANAGNSAHKGCTVSGVQYTTCAAYDSAYKTLAVSSGNALNQSTTTDYTASASGGFGFWPTSNTDFNAQTSSYAYDALGRMTSTTLPGETAGLATKSWTYTTWCAATGAQAPCVEIDEIQRIDSTTTVTSRAFYDGYGRLVETRGPGPNGQDVIQYAWYDVSGDRYFMSTAYFVPEYVGAPGAAAFVLPDVAQPGTTTAYDALNRMTSVSDALSQTTTASYAPACSVIPGDTACYQQVTAIDANGHQQRSFADAIDRLAYDQRFTGNSSGTYAVYATTKYQYDATGKATRITHPDGVTTTSFIYDAAGRKVAQGDPDRGDETYTYDQNGNLTKTIDARGAGGTIYAGYDGLNRQLWRNTSNTSSGAYVSYGYDSTLSGNKGIGRRTSEIFSAGSDLGSYAYTYDARGQMTGMTMTVNGASYSTSSTYDDVGQQLTQTYPTGEVVTTGYTAQTWLSGVNRTLGGTTTALLAAAAYTGAAGASGLMTGATLGNSVYTFAATYDPLARATSLTLTNTSTGAILFQQNPTYDAVSNVTGATTTLLMGDDIQRFCYDEQNRLIAASAAGTTSCGTFTPGSLTTAQYTQAFGYDTLNRLTSGPLGSYTYGDSTHKHAATAIGAGANTWTAQYDAAGNMTCRAPTNGVTCAGTPTGASLGYEVDPVSWTPVDWEMRYPGRCLHAETETTLSARVSCRSRAAGAHEREAPGADCP